MSMNANVHKLPAEVLCEIYLFLKVSSPPIRFINHHGWVRQTTHVCKRWRDISLRLPALWADMVCVFPSQAR